MKTNHRRGFVARLDIDERFTLNRILDNRHREKTLRFSNPQGITEQQAIDEGINETLVDEQEMWLETEKSELDFRSLEIEEQNYYSEEKNRSFRKYTLSECLSRIERRENREDYEGGGDYEYGCDWNAPSFESYLKDMAEEDTSED